MSDEFKSMAEIEKSEKVKMKKKKKAESAQIIELFKNTFIMLLIAVVAGGVLGLVYEITKTPIAEMEEKAKVEAHKSVFMLADSFSDSLPMEEFDFSNVKEMYPGVDITDCVEAYDSDKNLLGYVLEVTTHEGYGGDIVFALGVTIEGSINAISITQISETVGLGMNAETVLAPQFTNRNELVFEVVKNGAVMDNQIDAISSATITSRAVTGGVNAGLLFFRENLMGGESDEP